MLPSPHVETMDKFFMKAGWHEAQRKNALNDIKPYL